MQIFNEGLHSKTVEWPDCVTHHDVLVTSRDVNKARGVKAKAIKPRPRPETCKTKAKATDPRPRPRPRMRK